MSVRAALYKINYLLTPSPDDTCYIKFLLFANQCMTIEQILQIEIQESQRALDGAIDDTIYRRDHSKRIELINWVLEQMKNPGTFICEIIESKMNEIIDKINQTYDIFVADKYLANGQYWILYYSKYALLNSDLYIVF